MIEVSPLTPEETVEVRLGAKRITVEFIYQDTGEAAGLSYTLSSVDALETRVIFQSMSWCRFVSEEHSCWGCLIDWG